MPLYSLALRGAGDPLATSTAQARLLMPSSNTQPAAAKLRLLNTAAAIPHNRHIGQAVAAADLPALRKTRHRAHSAPRSKHSSTSRQRQYDASSPTARDLPPKDAPNALGSVAHAEDQSEQKPLPTQHLQARLPPLHVRSDPVPLVQNQSPRPQSAAWVRHLSL